MIYILRNAEGYPANHYMVGNHLETGDIEVPMRPDKHHIWNGTAWELSADGNQYQRDRAEAYPSLTEQADMAYWDRQNGTTTLDDAISAVKLQYPKPS